MTAYEKDVWSQRPQSQKSLRTRESGAEATAIQALARWPDRVAVAKRLENRTPK